MAIARHVSVPMTDLEDVAIPAAPAGANDRALADGANRRSSRCRVVGAGMPSHGPENRMLTETEDARDPTELERRTKEGRAHRLPILIEVVATRRTVCEANGVDHGAGELEGRGENLSDA